jgi:aminoglycoside/choline kinase family phosphotransferase
MHDPRLTALQNWLPIPLAKQTWALTPLAGDASFRRYFRVQLADRTLIAMDAPPPKEDTRPFIAIAQAFSKLGVHVPQIIAANIDHGFLLLSDLGDDLYLNLLNTDSAEQLYTQALETLQPIQSCREVPNHTLPHFDQTLLLKEWNLFHEWVIDKHWQAQINNAEQHLLRNTFEFLSQEFLAQPKTCVHRDYQSRNLLWLTNNKVGVLDFQDAVWGPVTYDALSLLRDCYIDWPRAQVEKWALYYYNYTRDSNGLLKNISGEQFLRWFDLASAQRHLKNLGIFTRLKHSYGKPHYLNHLPRTLNYVLQISESYPELQEFGKFLERYK